MVQLNPQQQKAVLHGKGPLLIIAGAGTGKTTVITERIKHLILSKHTSPQNILALTFTEKAALEMQERIDIALPYGYSDMWIHTFHAFCDRILRSNSIHIGLSSNYTMMTEAQSILFLRNHLFDLQLSYFRPLGNPDKFLQGLLQHFSRLKDEDVSPEEYIKYSQELLLVPQDDEDPEMIRELANAYTTYEKLKIKENVMDFSDLISNILLLFRTRKHILKKYQEQFQFLLIDEFQDTNFAQNQLALLLSGQAKNITVVGDDDQAIYRWRGAAISNMMQFRTHFPKAQVISLTENYRSSQTILDTAYAVIQNNNPDRLEIQEKIDKRLVAFGNIKKHHAIEYISQHRDDLEAEKVVEKIQELHSMGYAYKDFAILVRANDHAQPFLQTLTRYSIPHQFLGPGKLFHQEEIKDLIAYLKVLYNHDDAQSLYRVLTISIFGISAQDISTLLTTTKKESKKLFEVVKNYETLSLSEKSIQGITKICTLIAKHADMVVSATAGKILYDFLENSGLIQSYLKIKTQDDDIKAQNTSKFFEKLKQFEAHNTDASIYAVVDWIDLSMQLGESPLSTEIDWSENDAVNILTIHASKGLEFPVVFIVSLVGQRFPSRARSEQIPIPEKLIKEILPSGDYHLQEERRLFYVALTRAKEYAFLTWAKNYGGGKTERKVSPFVIESLGEKIVQEDKTSQADNTKTIQDIFPTNSTHLSQPIIHKPINYISYSQIQTFDICPLHYKLKYLLHVPTLPSASLSFGTSIHSALKEFYDKAIQGETVGIKDIPQILESVWISEGYVSEKHKDTAFKGGVLLLEKYLVENFNKNNLPVELEFPFQFSLDTLKVGGRIDRIDKHADGSFEIIDYKTGRNTYTEKNIKNNLQLAIYQMAAQKPNTTVSLHFLESGEKISTTFSQADLAKAKEKILAKVESIEKSDFTCSKSIFCEDCEYVMLCQAAK